jgi:(S)-ureidoglycine aminohydrolase
MPPKDPWSHLGHTRTRVTRSHAFLAPDGHVETALPGWEGSSLTLLLSPQIGARHTHYLARLGARGHSGAPLSGVERFCYVVSGEARLEADDQTHTLTAGGFAYLPAGCEHRLGASESAGEGATLSIFERRYIPLPGTDAPPVVVGHHDDVAGEAFLGDEHIIARKLLPDDFRFDMAANTMSFAPGASLPFAETHFMEHGMLMLQGQGIYRLGDAWYPITAGDALWMGPYCPQWFGALGREWSRYLLYKEANRDVLAFERES